MRHLAAGGAGSGIKIVRVPGDGTRPSDHYDVTRTHANALPTRVPNIPMALRSLSVQTF